MEYSIDKVIGNEIFATFEERIITMNDLKNIQEYWSRMYHTFDIGTYQLTEWNGNWGSIIWQRKITKKN